MTIPTPMPVSNSIYEWNRYWRHVRPEEAEAIALVRRAFCRAQAIKHEGAVRAYRESMEGEISVEA